MPVGSASVEGGPRVKEFIGQFTESGDKSSGKQILGKHQEKRSAISPTAAEYDASFSEDDGERYPGIERPFKTAGTSSGHDYESITWYDSNNSYSFRVAKGYWSANCAPRAPHQSPTTFATRNAEQCLTTIGGLFAPQFRADHPFVCSVCFPFHGLASRLPTWFLFGKARGNSFGAVASPRRGCQRAHHDASIQRGSESSIAQLRYHFEPKCSSFFRNQWASLADIAVPMARPTPCTPQDWPRP
ncbi:hypothetical protein MRX96_008012 [Rhipicephalus microplus]